MKSKIIQKAIETIQIEARSIQNLSNFINDDFEKIVELVFNSKGRLIVSGIGKSAIVAQKIVATLNSTGTPSLYACSRRNSWGSWDDTTRRYCNANQQKWRKPRNKDAGSIN